jgi:hypothetical protein
MRARGFANVHAEPAAVRHWERGPASGEVTSPRHQTVALAALGGSVGTPPGGIDAPVVEAESLAALDALPDDAVRGRIVYLHTVMRRTRDGSGYGAAVPVRVGAASHAARKHALAVLVRSIGTDDNRLPHTGALHYERDVPLIPAAAVSTPDGDMIHRMLAAGRVHFHLAMETEAFDDAPSSNVVGEIIGREPTRPVVLLGAHLDSWDLGTGALDDGAGCAIVLEVGRAFATGQERPLRTVRIVLFANEEYGEGGAEAYAAAHGNAAQTIAVAMEADAGDGAPWSVRMPTRWAHGVVANDVRAAVAPLGVSTSFETPRGGADVGPLGSMGVVLVDVRQDMSNYFDVHHTANDTVAALRPDAIERAVVGFGTVAWIFAGAERLSPGG